MGGAVYDKGRGAVELYIADIAWTEPEAIVRFGLRLAGAATEPRCTLVARRLASRWELISLDLSHVREELRAAQLEVSVIAPVVWARARARLEFEYD